MTSRRVGCSLLSLLPLLASLPNFLLIIVLLLSCSSSSLTLGAIAPTTPVSTTLIDLTFTSVRDEPNTTIPLQGNGWVEVLGAQNDDYDDDDDDDDDWFLNQTNCSSSVFSHDRSPRKDIVDFHDVKSQIVEHVLGKRGVLSDPEHLRLRAQAAWKHHEGQGLVLEAPLVFRQQLNIDTQGGELLESSEESEETVQALEEASVGENSDNRTTTEVENAEQETEDGSGSGDGESGEETSERSDSGYSDRGDEDDYSKRSADDQVNEYERNSGNYSKGSVAVANDNVTSEMVAGESEAITEDERGSEERRPKEGEEQGEETDLQEKKEDKLIEEKKKEEITEVTVEEGTRLRLVCNVTGVKHIWVEWRRAANLTFPGGSAVVGGRSVLFDFVGREDAGTYICTARNPHGSTYSTSLTIHVQYVPVVGVWARTMADEGVELGCLGEGQPRPSLVWYKNNTKLSTACERNTEVKSTPLSPGFMLSLVKFSNTTVDDFALYHCRAANSLGVSRSYLMLHDGSGAMSPDYLEEEYQVVYSTPVENPRLASFLLGMVPPLYIALYIIAYLGCYKSPSTGAGRFGTNVDTDAE